MSKQLKWHAPIETEIKVAITDGEQIGEVTIGLGIGVWPTPEKAQKAIADLATNDNLPPGWRVCTKREWWEKVCKEQFGQRFAMPGGEAWDA
jgi:hypothetical protein